MIDLEIPEGFKVKSFDYPMDGDYVLMTHGECMKVSTEDHAYHCAGIVLEEVWEPQTGKYYEFSDLPDFSCITTVGVYTSSEIDTYGRVLYFSDKGIGWYCIRPLEGELGT